MSIYSNQTECVLPLPNTNRLANELGTKYYFTGKRCSRNHVCLRYAAGGRCVVCININNRNRYAENKEDILEYKRNYYEENKEDILEHKRNYYEENKEDIREQQRNYYQENKEDILEYNRKRYEDNKEDILEYSKKRYEENKEYILERQRNYYEENKEHILQYQREYNKKNPDKVNALRAKRDAKKLNQTPDDANQELILHFFTRARELNEVYGTDMEVDHIIPLSKGGLHHEDNLQLLPQKLNGSKGAKTDWVHPNNVDEQELTNEMIQWLERFN